MCRPLAVLIVDDGEDDALMMLEALRRDGYEPAWKRVATIPSLQEALAERKWDVVLSDYNLPGFDGREALLKVHECSPDTPFLLVSGTVGEEVAVSLVKAGAADYLLKSNLLRLSTAVARAIEEAESRRTQREVEQRLRESEERYRTLMESIEEVVYAGHFDLNGEAGHPRRRLTFVSPRVKQIFGYSPEEFVAGKNLWLSRIVPEDRKRTAEALREAIEGRRTTTWMYRFRTKSGDVHWIETNFVPSFDAAGRPVRFFGTARDVTERRGNEEAFRIAQLALDCAGDLILWLDGNARIVYSNERARESLGYSKEQLLRMSVWDVSTTISPEDWPGVWVAPGELGPRTHQDIVRCRDGSTLEIEVGVTHVHHEGRDLLCLILRDLAGRKEAEKALRASESHYRALVESFPNLVFVLSPDGVFLDYHAKHREWLVAPPEGFLGRPMSDVLPPELVRQVGPALNDVVRNGGSRVVEYSLSFPSGKRYYDSRLTRMEDGRVMSVARDVTRMKKAEERLHDILEHSTNLFYAHTPDHRLVYVSPQSRHFLGCEPEEAIRWTDFVTDNPANQAGLESTDKAIETGVRQPSYELELRTRDGRSLWVEVNEAPIVKDGTTVSIVGALTDVTARKKAEADRSHAEHAMRLAQRMESIGRLAGGVAHDFNNLLSVILGYASFATEESRPGEPLYEDLLEIRKAGERATVLTRQLLAFSRRQVLRPTVLDLNTVVADTEKIFRRVLGEDIELVTTLCDGLFEVNADRGQMEQILMNLAVNARDAIPDGGSLVIETSNVEIDQAFADARPPMVPGTYVLLKVSDSGSGMDQEVLDRVFEPFFTTKEMGKGTGLGLSTVYGIVKQSNGFIWIDSERGQGTTFSIYLPRCQKEASVPVTVPGNALQANWFRDRVGGRRRKSSASSRGAHPQEGRLRGPCHRGCRRGAAAVRAVPKADSSASNRRHHAGNEWARARGTGFRDPPGNQGPVHVGLLRGHDRPSRGSRARDAAHHQAVRSGRAHSENS